MDRLTWSDILKEGKSEDTGTVAQILAQGDFRVNVMVRDGEKRKEVNSTGTGITLLCCCAP